MNNICAICKTIIDEQWTQLQEDVKKHTDLAIYLNNGFAVRCIYCYKVLLELTEAKEHEFYLLMLAATENK